MQEATKRNAMTDRHRTTIARLTFGPVCRAAFRNPKMELNQTRNNLRDLPICSCYVLTRVMRFEMQF